MSNKTRTKSRRKSAKDSVGESRAAMVSRARSALRVLGNSSPSDDQQHLALAALIHVAAHVDAKAIHWMAKDVIGDTGVSASRAFAVACVLIGLIETHSNHMALIKYLREGGPRPDVNDAFVALVAQVDRASGKAA